MGKKGGSSWLTAVKRAFRSPSKDSEKKSCRRKVDHQQEDEEEKVIHIYGVVPPKTPVLPAEQRHAIAVAAATAAAAEAAVATAKAAVEIIRLTQPSNATSFKLHSAAKVIQTAFRGYLHFCVLWGEGRDRAGKLELVREGRQESRADTAQSRPARAQSRAAEEI
ncbi:hypothetical protein DH2020_038029 [Rehmannia glutinosa]|uniref:Uncharacterized protein n=1 Tax=Rehmannia glutinosa TaxID=99300 RepID=A0ABR0UZQ4_REHGL